MGNLDGRRSEFPNEKDDIIELFNLPPALKTDALRYQTLILQESWTNEEKDELAVLTGVLNEYIIDPEKWNLFGDIIVNMQEFFIDDTQGYIDDLKNETRVYVDDKKGEISIYAEDKKLEFQGEMEKFTYRGNYSNGTIYQQWNIVTYNGESYLSLRPNNVNRTPNLVGNSNYWGKIATKGVKGEPGIGLVFLGSYDDGQSYSVGQAVNHNEVIYECIMTTIGHEPPNDTYWRYFLDSKAMLVSSTEPEAPTINQVWLDTNIDEQMIRYWNGTGWININAANAKTLGDMPFSYFASNEEATITTKGLMSDNDKSKLDGIQTGAEVNAVKSVAGKFGEVTLVKGDIGLSDVDNNKQMPIAGGTFTGIAKAQNNTSTTTPQIRNISSGTANPTGGSNGDIYFKRKV